MEDDKDLPQEKDGSSKSERIDYVQCHKLEFSLMFHQRMKLRGLESISGRTNYGSWSLSNHETL
jgi:hypothetical protein